MTAQKGRDLLLKLDATGSGSYTSIAGLRSNALSFNAATVDATSQESAGAWRELLSGAGLKSASIKGQGIFKDAASDQLVSAAFFASSILSWQVVIPNFGVITGPFQITSLDYAGRHDGELTFDLSLASAGELTFASL